MPTPSILILPRRVNNSWTVGLTKAEVLPSVFTQLSPSVFTPHQILNSRLFNKNLTVVTFALATSLILHQIQTIDSNLQHINSPTEEVLTVIIFPAGALHCGDHRVLRLCHESRVSSWRDALSGTEEFSQESGKLHCIPALQFYQIMSSALFVSDYVR